MGVSLGFLGGVANDVTQFVVLLSLDMFHTSPSSAARWIGNRMKSHTEKGKNLTAFQAYSPTLRLCLIEALYTC